MANKKSKRLENMDTLLHSEVGHEEHRTGWIIQNFSYYLAMKKVGEKIESSIFRVPQSQNFESPATSFKIVCFPSGITDKNKGYVSMKLESCSSGWPMNVTCDLSLINTEGEDCFKRRTTDGHSIPRFISHEELTVNVGKLLSGDQLIVSCLFKLGPKVHSQLLHNPLAPLPVEKYVHWTGDHPDEEAVYPLIVWLQLADGKLPTFSFPLAAHSEAFWAMFRHDPKKIYSFPDMSVKTGKELHFFLYTGLMKEDADVMELLVVADKYLIGSLKDACVRILKTSVINDDNWKDFFQLGNLCNVDQLKQLGMEHFKKFGHRIIKKIGWNEELSKADHAALLELLLS